MPLNIGPFNMLSECCFQLHETSVEKFEKTVKDDNIPIVISTIGDSPL
jgi:hypothetical protein